jgi:hypothetical protein
MMLFLWISPVFGQDSTRQKGSRIELSLEGMAGVSFGDKMVAFNVGGPNLLLALGSDWRIGFAAFPSFFVRDSKTGARLGVGGRVDYKKLVLFTSFYHFDTREIWVGTVGLGYKFHKSSQKK